MQSDASDGSNESMMGAGNLSEVQHQWEGLPMNVVNQQQEATKCHASAFFKGVTSLLLPSFPNPIQSP